jgi:hypothetical protein
VSGFDQPFQYWNGMITPPASEDAEREFNAHYDHVHVPEVVAANPGFISGTRYRRTPSPASEGGPGWLAVYAMRDEPTLRHYLDRDAGPASGRPVYTPGPALWNQKAGAWRIMWRRIDRAEMRGAGVGRAVRIVAWPADAGTDDGDAESLRAAARASDATAVTLLELVADLTGPAPAIPHRCAVFEFDSTGQPSEVGAISSRDADGVVDGGWDFQFEELIPVAPHG